MYKFVTSMVLCGLGMQQCAMHNATIQKTTFFELGVYYENKFEECKANMKSTWGLLSEVLNSKKSKSRLSTSFISVNISLILDQI